ncbi:MAG: radical SAM protein [Ignavibacteria bacterium]|nr:radical SAM protein [Ignavibacteria bacterium]
MFTPRYIELAQSGELHRRAQTALGFYSACTVCPHNCKVDRANGVFGVCGSTAMPIVSSYGPHHGEEPVISGTKGAGNIFFGNCNLQCVFCQNFEISQNRKKERAYEVSIPRLAEIMLELQSSGCHNIGLVSPTHHAPAIIAAIEIAALNGLRLPIVYNSNGYDSVEMLQLFEGVIDIYLPDLKYGNDEYGEQYSKAPGYFTSATDAIAEMYRQTGSELLISDGLLYHGLIIRHLVLPNDLSETEEVFKFISTKLGADVTISLMAQYYPIYKANDELLLSRPLRESEYNRVVKLLDKYGLTNGWLQEMESKDSYRPSFEVSRENPFGN